MVRALLWFRCAAVHDPVRPTQSAPARVGWAAKFRRVDLEIERGFKGDELLRRMKGWITVDPEAVIEAVGGRGRLRVLDDRDLVVECRAAADLEALGRELAERFGGEVDLEPLGARRIEEGEDGR
ncbi:MAG: hypothetical protein HY900_00540 [Deltaproteobacteria bacterium]|nr:hypothetical protein [Deltaproteobacteria bacterium]